MNPDRVTGVWCCCFILFDSAPKYFNAAVRKDEKQARKDFRFFIWRKDQIAKRRHTIKKGTAMQKDEN